MSDDLITPRKIGEQTSESPKIAKIWSILDPPPLSDEIINVNRISGQPLPFIKKNDNISQIIFLDFA